MIEKELILKSINDAINKCRATEKAKNIGNSCSITDVENDKGFNDHIYSYEDGTNITFDNDYNIKSITFDGVEYPYYLDDKSYDEFDYQKQSLMKTVRGEEPKTDFEKAVAVYDWEYLLEFADDFASVHGFMINNELRKGVDIDSENYENSWLDDTDALADHEWFVKVQNTLRADHDNYAALRVTKKIYDNEDLSKRIVSDKAHTSTSVGADTGALLRNFGNGVEYNPYGNDTITEDNFNDSWKTITLVQKDSGVHGVFFGTALNEGRHADSDFTRDWEKELNFPPNMKFERQIIDEKHKIIIQIPKV